LERFGKHVKEGCYKVLFSNYLYLSHLFQEFHRLSAYRHKNKFQIVHK
jgi:hypothetical protein